MLRIISRTVRESSINLVRKMASQASKGKIVWMDMEMSGKLNLFMKKIKSTKNHFSSF